MRIGVLGAGTWGMALARMLCNDGYEVNVWSALEKEIDELDSTRVHKNLPGMIIPAEIIFTKSIEEVCTDKDVLLFAVPSVYVRDTCRLAKDYIRENLVDKKEKVLKRNTNDEVVDISVMGAVYPFDVFDVNEKVVKNTVDKINMTLRTYKDGYLRFEDDSYMHGQTPWGITTLWMALYYLRAGDISSAEKCFKFVVNTSAKHGFLSEQVSNEDENYQWVIGLGWSHAMFIIVLDELLKAYEEGK